MAFPALTLASDLALPLSVISGIVHVPRSGCRWSDSPPEYGPPTTIYKRFVRWAQRGIWENLFRALAGTGHSTETQASDSTQFKAHRSASDEKRGEEKQAVGRSRGGRNTKIHALSDAKRRLIANFLTGGEAHDCPIAERIIRRVKPAKRMIGDRAHDSGELRERLNAQGTKPSPPQTPQPKEAVQLLHAP